MSDACARCGSAIEKDDLRCPVCAFATPGGGPAIDTTTVTVLRCTSCGAAVSYDVERRAPHCSFCGSTMRVERTEDPLQQAAFVVPFTLDERAAAVALASFLRSGGFFRPTDLGSASAIASMRPSFWAAWVFDAEADVAFATDSDAGHGRSQWAPHAGLCRMRFDRIIVSASRGLTPKESFALASGYDLGTARPIEAAAGAGPRDADVERFELQRSAARKHIASVIEGLAAQRVRSGIAPGQRFRKTHVSLVLCGLRTQRVLFPAYILSYRYRDRAYRVVVHGQRPELVVGEMPISVGRVLLVVAGVVAAVGLLAGIVALATR